MEILESTFTNFMLKLQALKLILNILKPQCFSNDYLNQQKEMNTTHDKQVIGYNIKKLAVISNKFRHYGLSKSQSECIENIILYYAFDHSNDILDISIYNKLQTNISKIERSYKNKTAILVRDLNHKNSNVLTTDILNEYNRFLLQSGFISRLNSIMEVILSNLRRINIKLFSKKYELIKENIQLYDKYRIDIELEKINFNICEHCHIKLTVDCDKGELLCIRCGLLFKLSGDVIENIDTIVQDNKPKNSSYDASNHCEFWLKRIFALEPTDIDDDIKLIVETWLKKNGYPPTCRNIRKALQKTKLSNHNTHVSLIHKLITGKSPEPPSHDEKNKIFNYFNKAVVAYNAIKKDTNIKYYPYFIWKIMEMIYVNPLRRIEILEYIHFQNLDTLKKNDKIWRQICQQIPEFAFIPTDRNMQYLYQE